MGNCFVNDICINNVTYIYSIIELRSTEVFQLSYSIDGMFSVDIPSDLPIPTELHSTELFVENEKS